MTCDSTHEPTNQFFYSSTNNKDILNSLEKFSSFVSVIRMTYYVLRMTFYYYRNFLKKYQSGNKRMTVNRSVN